VRKVKLQELKQIHQFGQIVLQRLRDQFSQLIGAEYSCLIFTFQNIHTALNISQYTPNKKTHPTDSHRARQQEPVLGSVRLQHAGQLRRIIFQSMALIHHLRSGSGQAKNT
jgi:hypothetical protein